MKQVDEYHIQIERERHDGRYTTMLVTATDQRTRTRYQMRLYSDYEGRVSVTARADAVRDVLKSIIVQTECKCRQIVDEPCPIHSHARAKVEAK